MKVLFIGGTGTISTWCSRLAVERGIELVFLNRGHNAAKVPQGVRVIKADIRNREEARAALKDETFDVVVDWIAFTTDHIENDIELFRGKTKQFIFISSASAYQSQPTQYLITESTPLKNPFWGYSRNKIACEEMLNAAYRDSDFPMTIVRPSHTYDNSLPTTFGGDYTVPDRMVRGQKIISHGDGSSLWTLTHSEDFAKGFVGLLGNVHSIGHALHITSDEALTWDQIHQIIGDAVGASPNVVHIPSDFIARFDEGIGAGIVGDKAKCAVFDNSKIKLFVPDFRATISFSEGVRRALKWFDEDASRKAPNANTNATIDKIIAAYEKAFDALG